MSYHENWLIYFCQLKGGHLSQWGHLIGTGCLFLVEQQNGVLWGTFESEKQQNTSTQIIICLSNQSILKLSMF